MSPPKCRGPGWPRSGGSIVELPASGTERLRPTRRGARDRRRRAHGTPDAGPVHRIGTKIVPSLPVREKGEAVVTRRTFVTGTLTAGIALIARKGFSQMPDSRTRSTELTELTLEEASRLIRSRELSPVEL